MNLDFKKRKDAVYSIILENAQSENKLFLLQEAIPILPRCKIGAK